MDPLSVVTVITAVIPFVTAAIKKLFKNRDISEEKKRGIHALIPIILGILSVGVVEYERTGDVVWSLAAGLSSGGVASSARDIDKNLTGLVKFAMNLFNKKK